VAAYPIRSVARDGGASVTPRFLFRMVKAATDTIATAITACRVRTGTVNTRSAPSVDPISVRTTHTYRRLPVMRIPFPTNGTDPPTLMSVKASMLVAIATWASMPKLIIAGIVIRDVLPVTTLITLVPKKTAMSKASFAVGTRV